MIRKFLISYNGKGQVQTREVPCPQVWNFKDRTENPVMFVSRKKLPKNFKLEPGKIIPIVPKLPKPPKPAGQNRAHTVALDCIAKDISDPAVVWEMLVEIYKGERGEGYLKAAFERTMKMIKGELKI